MPWAQEVVFVPWAQTYVEELIKQLLLLCRSVCVVWLCGVHVPATGVILFCVCLLAERSLEDHENVVEALAHWPKGNTANQILFRNNPDKFLLLQRPQLFMPSSHIYASSSATKSSEIFSEEKKKQMLLKVAMRYTAHTLHTRAHTHTHTHTCTHTHTHTRTHTHTHTHTHTYTHTHTQT